MLGRWVPVAFWAVYVSCIWVFNLLWSVQTLMLMWFAVNLLFEINLTWVCQFQSRPCHLLMFPAILKLTGILPSWVPVSESPLPVWCCVMTMTGSLVSLLPRNLNVFTWLHLSSSDLDKGVSLCLFLKSTISSSVLWRLSSRLLSGHQSAHIVFLSMMVVLSANFTREKQNTFELVSTYKSELDWTSSLWWFMMIFSRRLQPTVHGAHHLLNGAGVLKQKTRTEKSIVNFNLCKNVCNVSCSTTCCSVMAVAWCST